MRYSIMGVGNSDWSSTFHNIPKQVDKLMQELGATAIVPIGLSNVKTDLVGPFEEWQEAVKRFSGKETVANTIQNPGLDVTIDRNDVTNNVGGADSGIGTVLENKALADARIGFTKKHLRVCLPPASLTRLETILLFNLETMKMRLIEF